MFDISRLEGNHRQLTQQHIDQGFAGNCSLCPVAMVVSEMVNDTVSVDVDGSDYVRFYDKNGGKLVGKLLISGKLADWICNFDRDQPVETGTLFVFRQEDEDDGDCLWLGIQCGEPITYHPVPENIEVFITYEDDKPFGETWTGCIRTPGTLEYLIDPQDNCYYTMAQLKAKGIASFHLSNGHEVAVD